MLRAACGQRAEIMVHSGDGNHSGEAKVTIVIPCYNQGDFLTDCLISIQSQTFAAWETIVVDDCSTSGDPAGIVARFADPRITLIRHPVNQGLGAARNTGFRAARTELILPVDCDDKLERSFLEVTVSALQAQPDADCVHTDFQLFGTRGDIWRYPLKTPEDMLNAQWIPGPGTLMRKRVWERVGGYAEMPPPLCGNEDWDFWIGAVQHDLKPLHVPQAIYLYRRGPQSMSLSTMAYHDYAMREWIYRRQKAFFDRHRAGGRFLAKGYLISARAAAERRQPMRAASLLARAARAILP